MIKPDTRIEELSVEERIRLVIESDGYLIDLLRGCVVEGDLDLSKLEGLTHLPEGLEVKGNLELEYCINLVYLPKDLKVDGYLNLEYCSGLREVSNDLEVGDGFWLKGCDSLEEVPGGWWQNIYSLPDHFEED